MAPRLYFWRSSTSVFLLSPKLSTLMERIFTENIGTWMATLTVTFITIFFDKILEKIRFSLNRADLRTKYFEEMATEFSTYLFWVSIYQERFERGWTDDPEDLCLRSVSRFWDSAKFTACSFRNSY